ncbi:MAG: adenylate/guanylate cyclase domain-containing protein [Spirochaetia bacterium]
MLSKHPSDFIVPAVVVLLFAALGIAGIVSRLDGNVYDLFLRVQPTVREDPSLLLLDIDDNAIANVGEWPWSRDVMANGLVLMREMGASSVVFDIEYVSVSPHGLDTQALTSTLPDAFSQEFSQIQANTQDLVDSLRSGRIPLRDAGKYVSDLGDLNNQGKQRLLDAVQGVERDNDAYLGKAARFFGSAYVTVNTEIPDGSVPKDSVGYALSNLSLKSVDVRTDTTPRTASLVPAILPIAKGAAGAGFVNVIVDPDGVHRRIDLIKAYKGRYFAQLSFSALLPWLGNPTVVLNRNTIVLKAAKVPGKGTQDITIPLTSQGAFLINWPHKVYLKSFRHLSFYALVRENQRESDLLYNLKLMDQSGYLSYEKEQPGLLKAYDDADRMKKDILNGGSTDQIQEYVKARAAFFDEAGKFLKGHAQDEIQADIDKGLAQKGITAEQKKNFEQIKAQVPDIFDKTRGVYNDLSDIRGILSKSLQGAFCIIGESATSTTDLGVTPFASQYANMGLHAAVANTVLQGQFLREVPWWYGLILAALIAIAATFAILRLNPARSIVVGAAIVVFVAGSLLLAFRQTGVYFEAVSPVGSAFLTFIGLTAIKFLRAEREKGQVRSAFSQYLSPHVISDLLADPEKLKLGGEEKELSAMFSDVKGFSTISEVLKDPTKLVTLLNEYLTEMSNIILDLGGTIDKYEGDAIIAFFGAPVDLVDHSRRACLAAVRMRRAEKLLNERVIAEKLAPSPLLTRIGINTGSMVVGNMGTPQKMNYTIMGNAVNLASRLEGVNKQYGTWLMMSEHTYDTGGADFFVRKLDRVRVVGINEPTRLYELIEEKGAEENTVAQAVEVFHEGMQDFEAKKWKLAAATFRRVLKILPTDGPATVYLKRCQGFMRKPPADNWDGVYSLTTK